MAQTVTKSGTALINIIRGIIVDRVVSGEVNFFTDDELITSINLAKAGLFNRRPDAFNITTSTDGGETILVVDEPSDLGTASSTLVIKTWALEPLCYYAASIGLFLKSKDSFYREASEKLLEFYERVL